MSRANTFFDEEQKWTYEDYCLLKETARTLPKTNLRKAKKLLNEVERARIAADRTVDQMVELDELLRDLNNSMRICIDKAEEDH